MTGKKSPSGQAIIEYLLMVAVVVIALVAFASAYSNSTNSTTNTMQNGIDQVGSN